MSYIIRGFDLSIVPNIFQVELSGGRGRGRRRRSGGGGCASLIPHSISMCKERELLKILINIY